MGATHESLDILDTLPTSLVNPKMLGVEMDEVTRHFGLLSGREEEALLLRLSAMNYREIAGEMGIGVKSVSTLLTRA